MDYKIRMSFISFKKQAFFLQLLLGLLVVFAQTSSLDHDLEHKFHEKTELCAVFLAFDSDQDLLQGAIQTPEFVQIYSRSDYFHTVVHQVSSFAIRAPPQNLHS